MPYVASGEWEAWATSAMHLIRAAFGDTSVHHTNFAKSYSSCNGREGSFNALRGVFNAAKADFDGGYMFNVEALVSGEIFGDFVVAAKHAVAEGRKDVAAVLACAALEDSLKRYAALNGLQVGDKPMQEVVNALKTKGLVSGAQKSLLDAMPKIRDYAMHANWDKIRIEDVNGVIGFVESFLLAKFG